MNPLVSSLAPNQTVVSTENSRQFFSYGALIATVSNNNTVLTSKWDYSRTTIKYLCVFLGLSSKKDIEKRINAGTYKVN